MVWAQMELGAKAEWLGGRLLTTAAVYEIVKENVVVANPDPNAGLNGVPLSVAIGEATSRGFELDFVGDLTAIWTMTLGYAYNDVKRSHSLEPHSTPFALARFGKGWVCGSGHHCCSLRCAWG
jgi:outer membrane receptor for ferric coprogen and ferric-rhodotorulic acid